MNGWAMFWGSVLAIGLVVFAGLAIVVSIGGYRDIRVMLDKLGRSDRVGSSADDER